jgi:hypothetical protein
VVGAPVEEPSSLGHGGGPAAVGPAWHHDPVTTAQPHNLDAALAGLATHWSPLTIAEVNDYDVRVARVLGASPPIVTRRPTSSSSSSPARLTLHTEAGEVVLGPGDTYVVPRGVLHEPSADGETAILLFEPRATVNTGDTPGALTAERTLG